MPGYYPSYAPATQSSHHMQQHPAYYSQSGLQPLSTASPFQQAAANAYHHRNSLGYQQQGSIPYQHRNSMPHLFQASNGYPAKYSPFSQPTLPYGPQPNQLPVEKLESALYPMGEPAPGYNPSDKERRKSITPKAPPPAVVKDLAVMEDTTASGNILSNSDSRNDTPAEVSVEKPAPTIDNSKSNPAETVKRNDSDPSQYTNIDYETPTVIIESPAVSSLKPAVSDNNMGKPKQPKSLINTILFQCMFFLISVNLLFLQC